MTPQDVPSPQPTLRDLVHDTIKEAVLDGRKHAGDDVDYPVDYKTHEIVTAVRSLIATAKPEKKRQPIEPKAIRYNEDALEGYNVAIDEYEAALLHKLEGEG